MAASSALGLYVCTGRPCAAVKTFAEQFGELNFMIEELLMPDG